MWFSKDKTENVKNVENLYHEVNSLIKQQETLKKKIDDSYPFIDSLNKIRKELEDEKKKTKKLEQLYGNIDSLSKHNAMLEKNIQNVKSFKFLWFLFLLAGGMFLWFGASCSWQLLSLINENTVWQKLTPIIIGVVIVLFIMAAVLIYFAHKTQQYLSQKKGN